MKRWSLTLNDNVESERMDAFLNEIEIICRQYNLSISHEDGQGAFIIEEYGENKSLEHAMIGLTVKEL